MTSFLTMTADLGLGCRPHSTRSPCLEILLLVDGDVGPAEPSRTCHTWGDFFHCLGRGESGRRLSREKWFSK